MRYNLEINVLDETNPHEAPVASVVSQVSEDAFAAVEKVTAASAAIQQIQGLIASGTLEPGGRLPPERDLSGRLGMSRPTLREAVRALEALGVLEARPGQGTFVSSLSPEILASPLRFLLVANREATVQLFEVRIALEVSAARWAATAATHEQLTEIEGTLDHMEERIDDVQAFVDGDTSFHRLLHQASANLVLAAMLRSISELDRDARVVMSAPRVAREKTLPQHRSILEHLRSRQPEAAGIAMHEHLRSCWSDIFEAYELSVEILARVDGVAVRGLVDLT